MERRVKRPTSGEMMISLSDPGMTALHRVGLAGLWMTLKALEEENGGVPALDGGSWRRISNAVMIQWEDGEFFTRLFEKSFRVDTNGLIWFPALGRPMDSPEHAVVLQRALLSSFLQHGKTRKADPSTNARGICSIEVDDTPLVLLYRRINHYIHQDAVFDPIGTNALAGWYFPGGAVRHTGLGPTATAIEESPARALSLRYAPVGAVFFELNSRAGGARPQYAVVLPEVTDLRHYAAVRAVFLQQGAQRLYAAGTADAGLRLLSQLEAANLLDDLSAAFCRVISFGIVPWSKQQKTRVNLMTIRVHSRQTLHIFSLALQLFPLRLVQPKDNKPFWSVPQTPDLIAKNLSETKPWWHGFAEFVVDSDRRNTVFRYEQGGLSQMVQNSESLPPGPERTFIDACHEAWRRRMGQIAEKSRREGSDFKSQVGREFDRLRVSFSRCKNCATLREAITDFWARAGTPLLPLQEGWRDVLTLLDEQNWRKAKDLALLALASYRPRTEEERNAIEGTTEEEASE